MGGGYEVKKVKEKFVAKINIHSVYISCRLEKNVKTDQESFWSAANITPESKARTMMKLNVHISIQEQIHLDRRIFDIKKLFNLSNKYYLSTLIPPANLKRKKSSRTSNSMSIGIITNISCISLDMKTLN